MSVDLKIVKLGDVLDIRDGTHDTPKYVSEGIPLITSKNLTEEGLSFDVINYISDEDHEQISKRSKVDVDDILFGMIGTIGNPVLVETERDFSIKNVALFKNSNQEIFPKYLLHLLKSPSMQKQIAEATKGGTQKFVSLGVLRGLRASFPPLEEQKRIAAILDKADNLRRKRAQAIALADDFLRATFLDMFGDPVTNPKGWPVVNISDVCTDIVDCVNRTAPVVEYETNYKMIRTTNVRNYCVDLSEVRYVSKETFDIWTRRLLPVKGDIIFTREAPAGEAGIIESIENVFLGQRTMHFRPNTNKISPVFLLHELMGSGIKNQIERISAGSTVKHLSVPECKNFQVRVPSIDKQERFELIANKIKIMKNLFSINSEELTNSQSVLTAGLLN